jgi:cell division protein FtsN
VRKSNQKLRQQLEQQQQQEQQQKQQQQLEQQQKQQQLEQLKALHAQLSKTEAEAEQLRARLKDVEEKGCAAAAEAAELRKSLEARVQESLEEADWKGREGSMIYTAYLSKSILQVFNSEGLSIRYYFVFHEQL